MIERVIAVVTILVTLGIAALVVRNTKDDPLEERRAALRTALNQIQPENIEYKTTSDVNYLELLTGISNKGRLWEELIPPPPPPPPPPPVIEPPDLRQMLNGVVPSLRRQLGKGDSAKPLIKTPANPRGEFLGVGDSINGVEIRRVMEDNVLFGLMKDGKDYTIQIPRQ